MDNSGARIVTLKRYISLLDQEENRLNWVKGSPHANEQNRAEADASLRANATKRDNAQKELRGLEVRYRGGH